MARGTEFLRVAHLHCVHSQGLLQALGDETGDGSVFSLSLPPSLTSSLLLKDVKKKRGIGPFLPPCLLACLRSVLAYREPNSVLKLPGLALHGPGSVKPGCFPL